jgi:small-conductance mechanosensitive channel
VTFLLAAGDTGQAFGRNLTIADWVAAGIIAVGGIAGGYALRTVLSRALRRGDSERHAADGLARAACWAMVAAGVFWSLSVLGLRLGPVFGALGIGGVAVAFAAQSILANFLASIILQLRRPFRRGDQITTNDCEGVVEDVNFRTVRLRTYAGERVLVPCAEVLAQPITNHTTLGRRRTTLEIGVGYDADLEQAREVLLAATAATDGVLEKPGPEVWVKEFDESAVTLAVRFWHAPDQATLWRVRSHVAVAVKASLDSAGIAIPFPQRVLSFTSQVEPRSSADAPPSADQDHRAHS